VPFLAKPIEKITSMLLARSDSAEDIINRRLQVNDSIETKKVEGTTDDDRLNKKEDSEEQQMMVEQTIKGNNDVIAVKADNRKELDSADSKISINAQEIALKQIQQDFQDSRERQASLLRKVNAQESVVFRFMLVFASVSLLFLIWGGYILFQKGVNITAILAEFVALLGGAGSLILRQLQDRLKVKADSLEKQQDEQTKYLRAIQTVLSLTGSEREKQLAETAKWLRDKAGS
jgi:hypothetical protein